MADLTKRQGEVLEFIRETQHRYGHSPTLREISAHFGFKSPKAAADHLAALERKGVISKRERLARSLRILSPLEKFAQPVTRIPIYGSIPAGFADTRQQEALGCVSMDVSTLGIRATARTYALRVKGDSMTGRHIVDGDIAILEGGRLPREGDVVAALIDGESTLKTYGIEQGRPVLRAENPRYPRLVPAAELSIQGVLVGLVRGQEV